MDRDARLVRYETMAGNRRHFEALFFAVVAFSWFFGLAVWTALTALKYAPSGHAEIAAGAVLLGGALIAFRLFRRERSCFDVMIASWREISGEGPDRPKPNSRPGAMALAVAAQGIAGLVLVGMGIARI